ncbi:MAG TPA: efflux RND transporter permease subunit [Sandaracinaceae bacterium LLY-WYZ-13_1]|nr:efflux RND transporter permease subunit [Sandaracinaceae bacterium LLY-WYZ-13_1]
MSERPPEDPPERPEDARDAEDAEGSYDADGEEAPDTGRRRLTGIFAEASARLPSLGEMSIRRGVTTAMVYLALLGFGFFSLSRLPLNRLPEVDLPVIAVVTTYVGASPQDTETLLTEPIERAVASVENVENVQSTSRQGTSIVLISFTWGTDMDAAEVEVRKNLELFADDFLPDEASRPLTFAFDPSLAPVMFMALDGPMDGYQLRRIATEQVQPYLGRVEGVAAAEVMGGLDREIQVRLQPRWLQANGVSPGNVADALRGANVVVPSGSVDDGTQQLNLQPTSLFSRVDEIRDVIVGQHGGRPVRLREVADVVDTFEEQTHVVTADGEPAVMLAVRKQSDANTVQVAQSVREALPEIEERLPEGVSLVPLFDESRPIMRSISNLAQTGGQAFLLTGLVLLLFLRSWRSSLITVIAIPTSIVVAFVAMDALHVTLNLISMAGLALAIGMLVDNGIVVLEAAFQHLERGVRPARAALNGAREMSMPLVASTLTTVVVFLPILLVEGIAGELFRDMVLTICITLLSSLFVALSLVPLMASRMLGRAGPGRFERALKRLTGFLDRLTPRYERALGWALRRRKRILAGAFLAFAASLAVAPLLGQDFLPKADVSEIRVEVTAAPGTALEEMHALVGQVESVIREEVPEAEVVTADYGTAEGFAAIFGGTANKGTLRARLPPPAERARSQQAIEAALSERFRDIPGLEVKIAGFSLSGSGSDIEVKLFSEDLDQLRDFGERLRAEMEEVEGVREARFSMLSGAPELALRYDRERMRGLGIAPAAVASTVAAYYQGMPATTFREGGDEFTVQVRAPREMRRDLDTLRYLPIQTAAGGTVPLGSLVTIGDQLGPTDIERENQRRLARVELTRAEGTDLGTLIERVQSRVDDAGVPEGMYVELGGTAEDLRDAFFKLAMALLAALILVYMVMASQFESLVEPFVIMFTVPLAVIGVVAALALTGTSVQVTALVGVILLGGVVVNNGIVLIDVIKRRRAEGMELTEAALEAGRTRMRPILMTALTTILGMVPLSVGVGDGAETWAPMARAVVGGMTVSTFLTLFVIPVLYVMVAGTRDRRRARRRRARDRPSGAPPLPSRAREAA